MTLLSGAAATALSPHHHAEVSTAPDVTVRLGGTARGHDHAHRSTSGTTYDISAKGMLTPTGSTTVTGSLHVVSGISSGPPDGTLKLTTRKGTLTLQIPESVSLPPGLPTPTSTNEIVDTYVITKGTGAYSDDTGSGVVEFTFDGATSSGARAKGGRVDITFTTLTAPPPTTSIS